MTTDKARKRDVRARMDKTGERYAAARRHVVAPQRAGSGAVDAPSLPARVAEPGMSDAAIAKGTGRTWDEWFGLLDAWGAAARPHPDIARHVHGEYGIDGWWAQGVTVGYERARGLRATNQTARGFEVSVSKTITAPAADVWRSFVEPRRRSRWLERGLLRTRPGTGSVGRSARFDVPGDGTRVDIWIEGKDDARASVTVTHERLANAADVAAHRTAWKARLERLGDVWTTAGVAKRGRRTS